VCLLLYAAAPALAAEEDLAPDVLLLRDIKQRMRQNLTRIPNYTCLETITRGQRAPDRMVVAVPGTKVPYRRTDIVRIEVAEVGRSELFARPGEHDFQKRELSEFVTGGLIGDGLFSSFANNVFLNTVATYKYRGDETLEGRSTLRFDYDVPQLLSGYRFRSPYGQAILGYHGSFWVDPETYDAVRLEIVADVIPPELRVAGARDQIDYSRVRIGSADVLLPQSAEMMVWQNDNAGNRNQISFTHCREYGVESVIKFDDPETPSGLLDSHYVDLPPGVQLNLVLETPIDEASSHIGELISARVEVDAMHRRALAVPKDAVVTGRIRRMEVHKEGWPYVLAGLEFTMVGFNGKEARFFANLEKLVLPPGVQGPKRVTAHDLPGVGVISAPGNHLRLPKGTRMVWKTVPYDFGVQ
jgi:hypothetical protein